MASYNESTVSGSIWTRANNVTLLNPYGGLPTAIFHEENVVALSEGRHVAQAVGTCSDAFTAESSEETFQLVHPSTGEVIGTARYRDVYVLLSSLYLHVAKKRDVKEAEEAERAAQLEADRQALLNAPPPPDEPLTPVPPVSENPEPPAEPAPVV